MKTSFFGSRVCCSFRKALRAAATSGRSCSAACTLFFLKVRLMWWRNREIADWLTVTCSFAKRSRSSASVRSGCSATSSLTRSVCGSSEKVLYPPNLSGLTLPVSRLRLIIRQPYSKPCCTTRQLPRGYHRIRLPQRHVRADHRNKASPFITGLPVPVRTLNPIRAVLGIHHHRFNLFVKCSRRKRGGVDLRRRTVARD